jgi:hypothetical protein
MLPHDGQPVMLQVGDKIDYMKVVDGLQNLQVMLGSRHLYFHVLA